MSFDLFLQHFQAGAPSEADRDAVRRVISEVRVVLPDQWGQYDIPLVGGGIIRLEAATLESNELFDGCAFHLRGFSLEYCNFILKLAQAGDMVIFNAQGKDDPKNPVLVFSRESQGSQVPVGMYTHSALARDGLHLYTLLDGSYESWERYRAQILQDPGGRSDA